MSSSNQHEALTQELITQFRYVSANSVMFSQVVADKVGLHSTDNECLDFLILNGPSTAGQLAQYTGLTTGAITAMVDRLIKAGYVRREHSEQDRRKVLVIPDEEKIYKEISPYSMPMGEALVSLCAEFSDDELAVIARFITKANSLATGVIAQTRDAK
ncbi:MAG: MarR family transcriptional regulator [Anaerolineae bacterium]|nr:MarR family transcriptional regulator [Anaerolineae bacterium]